MICSTCKKEVAWYNKLGDNKFVYCLICKHNMPMPTPELKDHELKSLKNQVLVQTSGFEQMVRFDLFIGANLAFDNIKENIKKLSAHRVYVEELHREEHKE